jgi:hypothetical protein
MGEIVVGLVKATGFFNWVTAIKQDRIGRLKDSVPAACGFLSSALDDFG